MLSEFALANKCNKWQLKKQTKRVQPCCNRIMLFFFAAVSFSQIPDLQQITTFQQFFREKRDIQVYVAV